MVFMTTVNKLVHIGDFGDRFFGTTDSGART